MINESIAKIAAGYVSQKEKPGNSGFYDEEFEQKMIAVGWRKHYAWCAFFVELVWREAYGKVNSVIECDLRELFSPSAVDTFYNFKRNDTYGKYVSKKPVVGSLICWRYGDGWQGHIGIVEKIEGKELITIEGNTNSQGGREGIEVARKRRLLNFDFANNKLNLLGFINPIEP